MIERTSEAALETRSGLERIRADIDDLFASDRDLGEVLEEVARLGVRLLMQSAIEQLRALDGDGPGGGHHPWPVGADVVATLAEALIRPRPESRNERSGTAKAEGGASSRALDVQPIRGAVPNEEGLSNEQLCEHQHCGQGGPPRLLRMDISWASV